MLFAAEASSVRAARQFVVETLADFPTPFVEDIVLLASELATNSVTHGRSGFTLALDVDVNALRVEITDDAGELPRKRTPMADEPYGRGLHIVDSLAESWGVGLSPEGGKTIWVLVPLPASSQSFELASATDGNSGARVRFDDLIPGWLFGIRQPWQRFAVGVAGPLALLPIMDRLTDTASARPGAFLATLLILITCTAGALAVAIAGAGVVVEFWYFGLSPTHSFSLTGDSAFGVAGLTLLVIALVGLAYRLERSVEQVRQADDELRAEAESQSEMRRRAERIASQAEAVLNIGSVLASAKSIKEVAEAALNEINIPASPTFASVAIVEDNHLRVLATRGASLDLVGELEHVDLGRSAWLSAVLSGEPAYVEDRSEFAARYPSALVLQMYDSGSWLVSPFRAENTLGLLALHFTEPQPLKEFRLYFSLVSELLGTSIERARSEEQQRGQHRELEHAFAERDRIARTLSTSLLPPALPRLPGFAAAAWLTPASGDEVAGDFYDLFAVEDGWVAVLGDVCGKGAEAAAVASLARYASRASALENPDPAHVGRVANQALLSEPSDLFCTEAIVRYLRSEEALEVALAGHLQVRMVCDGEVERLGSFNAALGLATDAPRVERYRMELGALVVMFSDGLVERDPGFTERDLDRFLSEAKGADAHQLSTDLRALVDRLSPTHPDDVAVLVLERLA